MSEKAPSRQYSNSKENGTIVGRSVDEEFNEITGTIADQEALTDNPPYVEPFFVGRMALKEIVADRHRQLKPSTNRSVTYSPTDDGRRKVDAVTYGDND